MVPQSPNEAAFAAVVAIGHADPRREEGGMREKIVEREKERKQK